MSGIQDLKNFSFESESLEKRTMWASFYHWEGFRIVVLHKVHKNLSGIKKSWVTSRCWAPLNQAKWAEPVKLCATCNR